MFIYKKKWLYPTVAILNITNNCNLQCRYCFVNQKNEYMTLDIAIKIVEYLKKNYDWKKKHNLLKDKKTCSIYFFGGEPMLCYNNLIKPLVNYCNINYPNLFDFGMTTNGTLLNEENIQFLKENNFALMLSCDGIKDIQDFNRPYKNNNNSTFEAIINSINLFRKYNYFPVFRSTITPKSAKYFFANYIFAEQSGFKKVSFCLNYREKWSSEDLKILEQNIQDLFIYRLNQWENNITPILFDPSNYLLGEILKQNICLLNKKCKKLFYSNRINLDRCGLGINNIAVNYNGDFYICQELPTKEIRNNFYLGNLNTGISKKNHKQILKNYIKKFKKHKKSFNNCKNCLLNNKCKNFYCLPTQEDLKQLNLNTYQDSISCYYQKLFLKYIRTSLYILSKNNNLLFKDFIQSFSIFTPFKKRRK